MDSQEVASQGSVPLSVNHQTDHVGFPLRFEVVTRLHFFYYDVCHINQGSAKIHIGRELRQNLRQDHHEMTRIRCWQVDAFTSRAFGGNPAAVCWLEDAAEPEWMQLVAAEMNLSETAFVRPLAEGLELRWFTPTVEVDLCGHATLATAHALLSSQVVPRDQPLRFHTKSGLLTCTPAGEFLELNFPAMPAETVPPPPGLLEALGVQHVAEVARSKFDLLVELSDPDAVREVRPDFRKLEQIPCRGVIITARGDGEPYDFESRFFAPAVGVDEDPVCGSAHCCLASWWSKKLDKTTFLAYQSSARGGVLRLQLADDRVILGGQAVTVWQGEWLIP